MIFLFVTDFLKVLLQFATPKGFMVIGAAGFIAISLLFLYLKRDAPDTPTRDSVKSAVLWGKIGSGVVFVVGLIWMVISDPPPPPLCVSCCIRIIDSNILKLDQRLNQTVVDSTKIKLEGQIEIQKMLRQDLGKDTATARQTWEKYKNRYEGQVKELLK